MTSISAKQNPTFVSFKKSLLIFVLVLTFGFIQATPSVAAFSLTVTYRVDADPSELDEGISMYSDTHIVGSSEARAEQRRMASVAKQKSTQALMISACKLNDAFGARLKVTDARGGTAGLSNMNSVSVTGIKVVSNSANLPDYTEDEQAELEAEYSLYEDYPDYIEDGYIYYSIEAVCQFRGRVSLINSNAYRVFINGDAGPEYSKAELVKRKWSIVLVDN